MKRHIIAFILLLTLVLSWGRAPAVAAESVAARPPETALAGNPHSMASVDLSNWIHTLLNTRAPRTLTACTTPPSAIKIMPLGDSITKGNDGVEPPTELAIGYRLPLYMSLRNGGYNADFVGSLDHGMDYPGFDTDHEGHGGRQAGFIANGIEQWLTNNPADVVLLHIGTNDLNTQTPDIAQAVADVGSILDEIDIYSTDVPVILARIIDDVPGIPRELDVTTFNNQLDSMAQSRTNDDIIIVNMEDGAGINYQLTTNGGDMADNLHPYATGYEKMAAVWFDALDGMGLISCPLPPLIHSIPVTEAEVNQLYTYQVVASGNPVPTYELIAYPQGMTINANTGVISWQPGVAGSAAVTVRAKNGVAPASSQNFTITVIQPDISITMSPAVQHLNSGSAASFTVAITNTGSLALSNLSVTVPAAPGCNRTNLGSLNPGQSVSPYTCSLGGVTGDKNVVATASAKDPSNSTVTKTSNVALVDVLPKITLAQQNPANVSHPAPGGPVNFTLKVTNNSSETVTLTSLWNDNMGELTDPGNPKVASTDCSNSTVIAASSNVTCHVTATFTGAQDNTYNVFVEATAEDDEGNEASASAGGTMVTITEPPIKYTYLPFVLSNP